MTTMKVYLIFLHTPLPTRDVTVTEKINIYECLFCIKVEEIRGAHGAMHNFLHTREIRIRGRGVRGPPGISHRPKLIPLLH